LKKLFIIGGTGLVGAHLIGHLLKNEVQITAIYRSEEKKAEAISVISFYTSQDADFKKITWIIGNILDEEKLFHQIQGHDEVYHCAAMVSFSPFDKYKILRTNIEGTKNIINICIDHNIQKVGFISSVAAIGRSLTNEPANENDEIIYSKKFSPYKASKYLAELEAWRGIAEGLNVAIVNPSVILGEGFWENGSTPFFKQIDKGMKYYTTGSTGFVDVKDVCNSIIYLMDNELYAEKFILNSDHLTYQELFNSIAKKIGKPAPGTFASNKKLKFAWRFSYLISLITRKAPMISKYTAQSANSHTKYSNKKLVEATGLSFTPIEETIKRIADRFLEFKQNPLNH
jgi:nucleoside-diphosphate-sugar epimerase